MSGVPISLTNTLHSKRQPPEGTASSPLQIRSMLRSDVDLAVEWAAREGWNPGERDADCFYAADPKGFLMGFVRDEPVGCISVVEYDHSFGFLGFYIVRPEFRGKGYGFQLWQAGMLRLQGHVIGLDGVTSQQESYKNSGFVLAHRNTRFGGNPTCEKVEDQRLVVPSPALISKILEYDRTLFPASRETFLCCWLTPEQRYGLVLIEGDRVRGYGVIRECRQGCKIGPLFAETQEEADILFRSLVARRKSEPVYLDCPEPNGSAIELALRYGLSPVFETARMYRGQAPNVPLSRIYGITTFELG